ncbi:MAG TPA: hypothetical protein PKA28_19070 [Methylomusa anaerophila]|uniref:Uncharacterized protein n=1 Tax=Methylomusa anaerophila TaxID=1930071 RepID=A0A348AIA9_9FIRM|nr:hypothetical protein [Methylomusa anaerophila]BBB90807.1 hypothetical protein MAMMFC1_01468 [Methylomusa anaerophila]HML90536.1 hypothetical protein [Methylomusa anaerophila]
MNEVVCSSCFSCLPADLGNCPGCGGKVVLEGDNKTVIDRLEPNCLIHRYEGSDLLEPAVLIKEAKSNCKVATRLREFAKPVNVPKVKVYKFDQKILSSIQSLRNERTATIYRYDQLIQSHWQNLKPYHQ